MFKCFSHYLDNSKMCIANQEFRSLITLSCLKNFSKSKVPRSGIEQKAEAAAAIPFPLKPLFLAATAGAVNFYEFLIKYVRALL